MAGFRSLTTAWSTRVTCATHDDKFSQNRRHASNSPSISPHQVLFYGHALTPISRIVQPASYPQSNSTTATNIHIHTTSPSYFSPPPLPQSNHHPSTPSYPTTQPRPQPPPPLLRLPSLNGPVLAPPPPQLHDLLRELHLETENTVG